MKTDLLAKKSHMISVASLFIVVCMVTSLFCGCAISTGVDNPSEPGAAANEKGSEPIQTQEPMTNPKRMKSLEKKINKYLESQYGTFSVGVEDLSTGDFAYVNNVQARAASVIKVFVEAAAFKKISEGELKLNKKITLQDRTIEHAYGTGILQGYANGSVVTLKKCLELMMTCSDNRAANIVLDLVGIDYVNEFMKELGCSKKSSLGYYFYIDGAPKSNYLTTKDVNMFLGKLYRGECVSPKYDNMMIGFMKDNVNTTKLVSGLPNGIECAHKTGSITSREHDCGIVYGEKCTYAISILGEEVANGQSSYDVIAGVSRIVYKYMNK